MTADLQERSDPYTWRTSKEERRRKIYTRAYRDLERYSQQLSQCYYPGCPAEQTEMPARAPAQRLARRPITEAEKLD
jgi:hypothetical protein